MNNKTITTNSHKREDIITQILADKGGFRINNDPSLFYEERKIVYLKIKVTKNSETDNIMKELTFIRNEKDFQTTIELDGPDPKKKFEININKENIIIISNEEKQPVSFYISKMGESENSSKKSTGKRSTNSKNNDQNKKSQIKINNSFDFFFRDQTHKDEIYYIHVKQRSHEIDGSLIANNAINDLKNIVGDIIYYPRDITIQIAKGQKVFIEVKQNATIEKTFNQMKKVIEDIHEVCEENYIFLGVINKDNLLKCFSNDNNNLDKKEENFKAQIKTTIETYKKFNICFLIIENNEFLGNSLEDRADYSFYYYNLTSQQIDTKINALENKIDTKINALENKIDTKIKGIQSEVKGIQSEVKGIQSEVKEIQSEVKEIKREVKEIKNEIDGLNNKFNDIDSKMKDILELLRNKIGNNNNSSQQNSNNLSDGNKGSEKK